jgi:hypothetical protein
MDDSVFETLAFLDVAPPGRAVVAAGRAVFTDPSCSDTDIEDGSPVLVNPNRRYHPRSALYYSMVTALAKQQQLERWRSWAFSAWRVSGGPHTLAEARFLVTRVHQNIF